MIIEFLYPELANLYGESGHRRFLEKLFPEAEFVYTSLSDVPAFNNRVVDFLFLGAMSERAQEKVITALQAYRERLIGCIEDGCYMLFSGNALEVLGRSIDTGKGQIIPALGLFPFTAKRQMDERLNCFYLGQRTANIETEARAEDFSTAILGFKSQFSQAYLDEAEFASAGLTYFCQTEKGFGMNKALTGEGFVYKNLLGTYLLGPLLILNPDFTKLWLGKMSGSALLLPFEDTLQAAYAARLEDFQKPDTVL